VWIYDLDRKLAPAFPLGGRRAQGWSVVWSPDGALVAYADLGREGRGLERLPPAGGRRRSPEEIVRRGRRSTRSLDPRRRVLISTGSEKSPG
jgi:hypothetical protein